MVIFQSKNIVRLKKIMDVNIENVEGFASPDELCGWFESHHEIRNELWLMIYKKASGVPSINGEEAIIEAIAWGWIDGIRKAHNEKAFFQRYTPRSRRSNWSMRNRNYAETLIQTGRMQAAGLKEVELAKSDGRWDAAYAGSSDFQIPADFFAFLSGNKRAKKFFDSLSRTNLYAIYHRLQTARKPQTRQSRIEKIIAMLAKEEKFY